MESRKAFIYRMLALISEVQDKPNLTSKEVVSLLEFQLHNREIEILRDVENKVYTNYQKVGVHKSTLINLDKLFKLILTKHLHNGTS